MHEVLLEKFQTVVVGHHSKITNYVKKSSKNFKQGLT